MSYPGYPGYPQGGAPPPQQPMGGYPTPSYPQTNQQYPPAQSGYPSNTAGGYPQPGYPPATGGVYPGYPSTSPAPVSGYGAQPQPPYGAPAPYGGQPQPAYGGMPQPAYGAQPQPAYGSQPSPYGGAPAASFAPQPQPSAYGGAPTTPYGAPTTPYGAPTAPYGAPAAPYGAPAAPHGAPAAPYGAPAAPYGAPAAPNGAPQSNIPMAPNGQSQSPHQSPYANNPLVSMGGAQGSPQNPVMNVVQLKGTPTVRPHPGFNARQDAEALRKAMKGMGTNEKAIIAILAHRTSAQRMEIVSQYKTLHGKDLLKDLRSELNGSFEQLVIALLTPLPQYYAEEMHEAVSGMGTDEAAIIEVLCTLDNNQIRAINAAYQTLYRSSLEKDFRKDTSGYFKRLLVSLCNASRDESTTVDTNACAQDAQALIAAGKKKLGTDETTFNAILCSRSYVQLQQIFADYERLAGHTFEKTIQSEFSGDIEKGLLAIVKSVRNTPAFFAERLHASLSGLGTKDRSLIRIVVTRSEVDLGDIKLEFQVRYKGTLEKFVSGDTSGDYRNCLVALIS